MIILENVPLGSLGQVTYAKRLLVQDYGSKKPLAGVALRAYDTDGNLIGEGETDAKGEALLSLMLAQWKPFSLYLTAAEYGEKKWTGVTDPGGDVSVIELLKTESGSDLTTPLLIGGVLVLGVGLYLLLA